MIRTEKKRLTSFKGNQTVIRERYLMGLGSLQDLEAARTTVASTAASLEARMLALKKSRRVIQTYLGVLELESFQFPQDLPRVETRMVGIPGKTLGLRPDLRVAFAGIQAADLRTRMALRPCCRTSVFRRISLT
jgi:outer membrane protein TolC